MNQTVLFLIGVISFYCNCVQSTRPVSPPTAEATTPSTVNYADTCGMKLSDEEVRILQNEKIVVADEEAQFLVSRDLTGNCETAVKIGSFFWAVVMGRDTASDRAFARFHSKEIVAVLRATWKSRALSSDGIAHEKYALLLNDGLPEKAIGGLVKELLETEDLFPGEAGLQPVIINRHFPEVVPVLQQILVTPEIVTNLDRRLFVLIALYKNSPSNTAALKELRELSNSSQLSDPKRRQLARLLTKFERRQRVNYKDIVELGLRFTSVE